jgi:hypothetical protein
MADGALTLVGEVMKAPKYIKEWAWTACTVQLNWKRNMVWIDATHPRVAPLDWIPNPAIRTSAGWTKSNLDTTLQDIISDWKMFKSQSFASDHLKNFNLLHSEILRPSQDVIPCKSRIVRVKPSQVRETVVGTLPLAAKIQVVPTTEYWTIQTVVIDRIRSLRLLENAGRETVGILDCEQETRLTWI